MRHLAGAPVVCSAEPKGVNLMAFLDAGDAGRVGEEWLSGMARAVGIERGRIERFTGHMGEPQADAHTVMLWDGPSPLACYTVVRDDFNRSKLLLWTRGSAGNAGVQSAPGLRWREDLRALLMELRPITAYGVVGSRDVDQARYRAALDSAIALLDAASSAGNAGVKTVEAASLPASPRDPADWLVPREKRHYPDGVNAAPLDEIPDTELPGMWERADFTGGQDAVRGSTGTDSVKPWPLTGCSGPLTDCDMEDAGVRAGSPAAQQGGNSDG